MRNTEEIWRLVDAKAPEAIELSDRVWGMPELCYAEHRSCAEHTAMLEAHGFRVTKNVAGIPTAVMGEAGDCLLYTSPSPRDVEESRMPSSA